MVKKTIPRVQMINVERAERKERLKQAREAAYPGTGVSEVVRQIGARRAFYGGPINRQTYASFERRGNFKQSDARCFAEFYGVLEDWLWSGKPPMRATPGKDVENGRRSVSAPTGPAQKGWEKPGSARSVGEGESLSLVMDPEAEVRRRTPSSLSTRKPLFHRSLLMDEGYQVDPSTATGELAAWLEQRLVEGMQVWRVATRAVDRLGISPGSYVLVKPGDSPPPDRSAVIARQTTDEGPRIIFRCCVDGLLITASNKQSLEPTVEVDGHSVVLIGTIEDISPGP